MTAKQKTRLAVAARFMIAVAVLVVALFPVYWMVTMAFKPNVEWTPTTGETFWVPHDWTLANFTRIFGGEEGERQASSSRRRSMQCHRSCTA